MPDARTTIERAIELAQSGEHASVNEIRQRLKREGHEDIGTELKSPAVNQQLVTLLKQSRH